MNERKSPKKLLMILIPALSVTVIAAVLLLVLLPKQGGETVEPTEVSLSSETEGESSSEEEPVSAERPALYYNVDYEYYSFGNEGGLSSRKKEEDGLWHLYLSVDGVQKEYTTGEAKLLNFIDARPFVLITADEDGTIRDAKKPEAFGYEVAMDEGFVEEYLPEEGKLTANTAETMDGFYVSVPLTGPYRIFSTENMQDPAPEVTLERGMRFTVWQYGVPGTETPELLIYLLPTELPPEDRLYWNVERLWNNDIQNTTRTPNDEGEYVFKVYHNGEETLIRTKSRDLAKTIDSYAFKCFAARFDKEGYVMEVKRCQEPFHGSSAASWHHVLRFENPEETEFFAKKLTVGASDYGNEVSVRMTENCRVINASSMVDDHPGEYTKLRVSDQVHVILNADGEAVAVFVVSRKADSPVYWNVERQYDSDLKSTKRTPDGEGYYRFLMAVEGKQVTVRTKEKSIADSIDALAVRQVGLKLNGDVIEKVYTPASTGLVGNFGSVASWYDVESFDNASNTKLTARKNAAGSDQGQVATVELASDCQIYNVSSRVSAYEGEKTTLQLNDRIHGILDSEGRARIIFVVGRSLHADVYWNVSRKYDSTKKETTRTPGADGRYHFEMAVNGSLVQVETPDRSIATKMDAFAARAMGLILEADQKTVKTVISPGDIYEYGGGSSSSWCDVLSVSGKNFTTQKLNDTSSSYYMKVYQETMAGDCKVYNMSGFYDGETEGHHVGESAAVRKGDVVHVLLNKDKKAAIVFIVSRSYEVIAHKDDRACPECGKKVTWTAWTKADSLPTTGGHYYLCGNVTLKDQTGPQENENVVLSLNGFTVQGADTTRVVSGRGNGSSLTIVGYVPGSTVKAGAYQDPSGNNAGLIAWDRNGDVRIFGGTYDASNVKTPENASAFFVQGGHLLEIHDALIIGGEAAKSGGALFVSTGEALLENVTIRGGRGMKYREVIAVGAAGHLTLKGKIVFENVEAGFAHLFTYGGKTTLNGLSEGSSVISVRMSVPGAFTDNYEAGAEAFFTSADSEFLIGKDEGALKLVSNHLHCACGTGTVAGHAHETVSWTAWTKTDSLPKTAGNWYLTSDVTVSQSQVFQNVTGVSICLNGHTVTSNYAGRALRLEGTSSLTLTDCQKSGVIRNATASSNQGGAVISASGTTDLKVYGLTLDASGHVNTYGSVLFAETALDNAAFYGCTLLAGSVTKNGGAIWASGILLLSDTTVTGGKALSTESGMGRGGNIFLAGTADAVFSGSTAILNGTAEDGGNVHVRGKRKITVGEGVRIENGLSLTKGGGNFSIVMGELVLNGGTVRQGIARTAGGGNVFVEEGAVFTMNGGTVAEGFANVNGYNVQANGTFTLSGGTVAGKGSDSGTLTGHFSISASSESARIFITGGTVAEDVQNVKANSVITVSGGRIGSGVTAYRGQILITGGRFGGTLSQSTGTVRVSGGLFVKEVPAGMIQDGCVLTPGTYASPDPSDTTVYQYQVAAAS